MLIFPKRSSDSNLTQQQNFFHFTVILSYWIFYVTSPVLLSPTPFGPCSFRISSCSVRFLSLRSWSRLVSPPAGYKYTNLKFGVVGWWWWKLWRISFNQCVQWYCSEMLNLISVIVFCFRDYWGLKLEDCCWEATCIVRTFRQWETLLKMQQTCKLWPINVRKYIFYRYWKIQAKPCVRVQAGSHGNSCKQPCPVQASAGSWQ